MKDHSASFQENLDRVTELGNRVGEPAIKAAEVVSESVNRLVEDQLQLGRAWFDVYSGQLQRLGEVERLGDFSADTGGLAGYRDAASGYAEALRANVETTGAALTRIGEEAAAEWRKVAESAVGTFTEGARSAYEQAAAKADEAVPTAA